MNSAEHAIQHTVEQQSCIGGNSALAARRLHDLRGKSACLL